MCDSNTIISWINPDLTAEEYDQCQYPARDLNDTDQTSADFRVQHPTSPLTAAGFTVTPIGMEISGLGGKRRLHGRIAGYEVSVNGPACAIGHNRLLVNGVPQAARVAYWLLRYWLARNGCTQEGLDNIDLDNADFDDLTLTFLFPFGSEKEARAALYEFRTHSETVLNKRGKKGDKTRKVAYSIPPEPVGPESDHNYTSYVRQREFLIKAYVKELNQPKAKTLPLADDGLEAEVQERTVRTLRVEVQVHGKWLKDEELNKASAWKGNAKPYEKVFGLIRKTLRLDEKIRTKRLKKTSIPKLDLCADDKELLAYHLDGGVVRDHEVFRDMAEPNRSKYYSAIRLRALRKVGIDFDFPYANRNLLSPQLSEWLDFPGEFEPDQKESGDYLGGYVFSRVSLPVVVAKLKAITAEVMENGPDSVPPVPDRTVYNGPSERNCTHSVGSAPLAPNSPPDEIIEVDGEPRLV